MKACSNRRSLRVLLLAATGRQGGGQGRTRDAAESPVAQGSMRVRETG